MDERLSQTIPKRDALSGSNPKKFAAIALLFMLAAISSNAQSQIETAPAQSPATATSSAPTLHVYTNLKQVPVLVLAHDYERMKPIDTSGFRLSLDSGPRFRPTYVRREGDDPISLAILIDASKPDNELLPPLIQAIAALPPDFLHPQDRVSVYAIDCALIRTTYDAAANPTVLADGVRRAMMPWQIRQTQNAELKKQKKAPLPPCRVRLPLWDSMADVLDDLDQQPGRRVLLAITDGEDTGSRSLWKDVMLHAQLHSEAVFGLLPNPTIIVEKSHETSEMFPFHSPFLNNHEDKFEQICVNSGGIQLQASEHTTMYRLKEFTQMLRERYILEFPRATTEEAGIHTLAVTYRKRNNLYIASAGISVPIASEEERRGANTIQPDPSREPTEGDRKVLSPKH
ncbi:hypothetical protein [Granulicella sp. S190]|uniref:hypothetical protein n=1 Tax=Granulicella sp. S190 TaxID=1747226 RepID=UPI00131B488F|nr:hypothetical protein [Granulicella sp. S190]